MKVISLSYETAGYACSIGTSIKKKYNKETNFFDYLVVDMNTINTILLLENISLLKNDFEYEKQENSANNITLIWKNFSKLISYHDLKKDFNAEDLDNVRLKYIRRYYRLLNDICNQKLLYFIRYGKSKYEDIKKFLEIIKNYNKNCKVYFINIDYDENIEKNIEYSDINNYIYLNFYDFNNNISNNDDIYFRILDYNWEVVFNIIENNSDFFK